MTERNPDAGQGDESEPALPADEEAAWAEIVAAYGEEPDGLPDPEENAEPDQDPGPYADVLPDAGQDAAPGPVSVTKNRPEPGAGEDTTGPSRDADATGERDSDAGVRSFTVYSAGSGPRDWQPPEGRDGEDGEGHFVPPEPPPLPEADAITKFAWLAALGGPLLLIGAVLFRFPMTWWLVTLGVGGFLGGFATLVARMHDGRDDDDFDDPGRGAVV